MGFAVTYPGGIKDAEFQTYVRLLRKRGVDTGKLPRVPEPETHRRWLHVWPTAEEAESFATELRTLTEDENWHVVETTVSPSEGPLGPIAIQLARSGSGLTFGLHPLSHAIISSAYPETQFAASTVKVDHSTWETFQQRGTFAELVRTIAPTLTGLSLDRLRHLGYFVLDVETDTTLDFVPPTEITRSYAPAPVAG